MRTAFINLYGAPGSGKTTCAMELAAKLKKAAVPTFLLQEYAAYLVVSGRGGELEHEQGLVLAKQNHAQRIVDGKCAVAVTDSPLMLCPFYAPGGYPATFKPWARDLYDSHANVAFFLERSGLVEDWQQEGRRHGSQESSGLSGRLLNFLEAEAIPFERVPLDCDPAAWIFSRVSDLGLLGRPGGRDA